MRGEEKIRERKKRMNTRKHRNRAKKTKRQNGETRT